MQNFSIRVFVAGIIMIFNFMLLYEKNM